MNNIRKYLIEGLLVIVLLTLLLVLMFPRFKEAQVRVKVVQTQRNLEETRKAINSYLMEHDFVEKYIGARSFEFFSLTTPTSYITDFSFTFDPFKIPLIGTLSSPQFFFTSNNAVLQISLDDTKTIVDPEYVIHSIGPSRNFLGMPIIHRDPIQKNFFRFGNLYSPSNGIKSVGFIYATAQGVVDVE